MEPTHMQLSQSKVQRQCYAALELFWGFFLSLPCCFLNQAIFKKPSHTRKWKRVPSPGVALEFLYTLPLYIFSSLTAVCELATFHSHISIFSRPRSSVSPSLPLYLSHFLSPQLSMPLILGVMGSTTTDHMGSNQITVARALDMIRNSDDGQVPSSVNAVLERALGEIWNRISLQPNSYVMSRDEFTIFNRYRSRFDSNRVAQQAVARFWNNFQGSRSEINNQSSL